MKTKEKNQIENWVEVELGEVLNYEQPFKYIVESTNYDKTGIPVLTAGKSFVLGYTSETKGIYTKLPVIIFDDFTTDCKFVDFPFKVKSSAMKFLKEKSKNKTNLKFIFELLSTIKITSIGGDHKRRWISEYKKRKIFIPKSYDEQSLIAEILSTVDRAIEQTEAVIAKLQRIKTGLMQDLLTKGIDEQGNIRSEKTHCFKDSPLGRIPVEWEVVELDRLVNHVGSGITPRGGEAVYTKEGILFIRSQNVTFEGLDLSDVAHIPNEIHRMMKNSKLQPHDVLLNITGASIGRCCVFPENLGEANVNQHVCIIRLKKTSPYDSLYLNYLLESFIGQNQIERLNAGGNREGLNYKQIKSFLIPWPKKSEREKISLILQQSSNQIRVEKKKLLKLKRLKTALMQDLLTGRVRVTELLKKREKVVAQ